MWRIRQTPPRAPITFREVRPWQEHRARLRFRQSQRDEPCRPAAAIARVPEIALHICIGAGGTARVTLDGVGISNGQKPTLICVRLYRCLARPVRERAWKAHFVRLPTHVDAIATCRGWPYHRDFAARESRASGMVASADALLHADDAGEGHRDVPTKIQKNLAF